jgi:hypothetical protein
VQTLWLSDSPPTPDLWSRLRAEHAASGLWPLLLDPLDPQDTDFRPWACGELSPERMSMRAAAFGLPLTKAVPLGPN